MARGNPDHTMNQCATSGCFSARLGDTTRCADHQLPRSTATSDAATCAVPTCGCSTHRNGYCFDHHTGAGAEPVPEETADALAEDLGRRPSYLGGGR